MKITINNEVVEDLKVVNQEEVYSFEEFQLFYESTEKVTDRRLEFGRWSYSVCTAMLIACVVIWSWLLTHSETQELLGLGFFATGLISILGIIYCWYWFKQIKYYKVLNNAKFDVLENMAKKIHFSDEMYSNMKSFLPFEKEWAKMKDLEALEDLGSSDMEVLKASNNELFLPVAFAFLFFLFAIVSFSVCKNIDIIRAIETLKDLPLS